MCLSKVILAPVTLHWMKNEPPLVGSLILNNLSNLASTSSAVQASGTCRMFIASSIGIRPSTFFSDSPAFWLKPHSNFGFLTVL